MNAGSRSEAAAVQQNDAGSNSSLSYDDIDVEEESSGAAAPSSHKTHHDYINTQPAGKAWHTLKALWKHIMYYDNMKNVEYL